MAEETETEEVTPEEEPEIVEPYVDPLSVEGLMRDYVENEDLTQPGELTLPAEVMNNVGGTTFFIFCDTVARACKDAGWFKFTRMPNDDGSMTLSWSDPVGG